MSILDQERRLIDLVGEYRDRECRALLARAREKAAELRRQAYREARARLGAAIARERERAAERLRSAEADLQTRQRGQTRRRTAALLEEAWPLLRGEIARAWREPLQRRDWIRRATAQAARDLPHRDWAVEHPADWTAADTRTLLAGVPADLASPPRLTPVPGIEAGLVLRCGATALDMTLSGLLRDRGAVEARLLALAGGETTP